MLWSEMVVARWRWRRFVVRRRRLLVPVLLLLGAGGFLLAGDLWMHFVGTVVSGRAPIAGQVLIRPVVGRGVVRAASVTLLPLGPSGPVALYGAVRRSPVPLVVRPDHAGRWEARHVRRGWHYAVVVAAEGCSPRFAGAVDVGWLSAVRVDHSMRSCDPGAPVRGCL